MHQEGNMIFRVTPILGDNDKQLINNSNNDVTPSATNRWLRSFQDEVKLGPKLPIYGKPNRNKPVRDGRLRSVHDYGVEVRVGPNLIIYFECDDSNTGQKQNVSPPLIDLTHL